MPYNRLGDLQTLTLGTSATCDNPCCVLTLDDVVELMGNISLNGYSSGEALATLPSSMRPVHDIIVPVCLDNSELALVPLRVAPNGEMSLDSSVDTGTLYLNGVTFNVCDQYYNSTIGNNFSQGTAPLRWDGETY